MKKIIILVLVLALAAGAAFWYWRQNNTANQVNYLTEAAARGTVTRQVVATGKMDAVDLVSVGAQVSGQIEKLHVELGQQVKKGDLVAEIDSVSQLNQYNTDKAALASHQAIAHEDFVHLAGWQPGAFNRCADGRATEVVGSKGGEVALEAAHGRAGSGNDDDGVRGHGGLLQNMMDGNGWAMPAWMPARRPLITWGPCGWRRRGG